MKAIIIITIVFALIGFVFVGSIIIVLLKTMAENNRPYDGLQSLDMENQISQKKDNVIRMN